MTREQMLLVLLFAGLLLIGLLIAWLRAMRPDGEDARIPYERPDFRDRAGFAVRDIPGDEIVELQGCYLSHRNTVGELEFRIEPGWKAVLRVAQAANSLHLEELDGPYDENHVVYLDGVRVLVRSSPGGMFLGSWTRGDFRYALYCEEGEMGMTGGLIDDFVREMDAAAG